MTFKGKAIGDRETGDTGLWASELRAGESSYGGCPIPSIYAASSAATSSVSRFAHIGFGSIVTPQT